MRILAMILPQHANEDVDMVDKVAEEEELQVVTSIKWTGHQEEIVLKLSHHVISECNPNLRLKLSHHEIREHNPNLRLKLFHHVIRECKPWYHPRLKPKLYQPINPKPKPHHSLRSYP